MHKQLLLFQNAISAYFAGNKQALDNCIKEFHIKIKNNEGKQPSFLEHWCCCGNICHLGMLIKDSVSCRHTWNWKDVWNFCLAKFCWCRKKQNYNIKWKEEFWLLCRMKWKEEFWLLCSMKIFWFKFTVLPWIVLSTQKYIKFQQEKIASICSSQLNKKVLKKIICHFRFIILRVIWIQNINEWIIFCIVVLSARLCNLLHVNQNAVRMSSQKTFQLSGMANVCKKNATNCKSFKIWLLRNFMLLGKYCFILSSWQSNGKSSWLIEIVIPKIKQSVISGRVD